MASDLEMKSYYKSCYRKLLDDLKIVKLERPEDYDAVARVIRNFREWAMDVASLDGLQEVPDK